MKKTIQFLLFAISIILIASCANTRKAVQSGPLQPSILSRKEWNAAPAILPMQAHTPRYITIHHTATLQKPDRTLPDKLKSLQQFSQREDKLSSGKVKPPWPDVPYHYYVDCKGNIGEGREIKYVGDTNTEYDPTGHILIVLEGNFENEQPTPEQLAALHRLVAWLSYHWHIPAAQIKGHQDYAKTLCPGSHLGTLLPELRKSIAVRQRTS
ncbi:MAG: hypothetical protein JWQ71_3988 [Pedosphaera sp.]|nr:hypothetical protein [Pedosphaera sp.]